MKEKTKRYRKSKLPFYFLPIGRSQFIIHTCKRETADIIAAIGCSHNKVVVIAPAYLKLCHRIIEKAVTHNLGKVRHFAVKEGDGFGIDTWDEQIRNFSQS